MSTCYINPPSSCKQLHSLCLTGREGNRRVRMILIGRAKRAPHGWYICDFNICIYGTYVGVCVTPFFFFLRRALCAVQSSCTVFFGCARPTHALHASSMILTITFIPPGPSWPARTAPPRPRPRACPSVVTAQQMSGSVMYELV